MICKKFSIKSWSDYTEDERSHRVSTDDYDCCSASTKENNESKKTAVLWLQERRQDLTKFKEHTYKLFIQEVWCEECQVHHC